MNEDLKKLRYKIYKFYINNYELSGFKGLVHDLAVLKDFTEENVLKICLNYKIYSIDMLKYYIPINSNFNLIIETKF